MKTLLLLKFSRSIKVSLLLIICCIFFSCQNKVIENCIEQADANIVVLPFDGCSCVIDISREVSKIEEDHLMIIASSKEEKFIEMNIQSMKQTDIYRDHDLSVKNCFGVSDYAKLIKIRGGKVRKSLEISPKNILIYKDKDSIIDFFKD